MGPLSVVHIDEGSTVSKGTPLARRSFAEILIDVLKEQPSHQASPRRLAELTGWPLEKVERVVAASRNDPNIALEVGRGGTVQHRGTERGSSVGVYRDVQRIITDYWGPRDLGLRNISVFDTSKAGTRGAGVWAHPDLVIAADPRRRAYSEEPRRLHAVEVETEKGFDLRSIYQAHAQGRGADYSWVIGNTDPGVERDDWERIEWAAEELGIGLVTYTKAGSYTTWETHLEAQHRAPDEDEREAFIKLAIGEYLRTEYEL